MPKALKHIALFARKKDKDTFEILQNLARLLADYPITWETETAKIANMTNVNTADYSDLGKNCDLIIVVGGDGTILRSVHSAMQHNTPVIGINKGRLGFLTDIRPNELDSRLLDVLSGNYWLAERFLLESTVTYPSGEIQDVGIALNDIILHRGTTLDMLDFEVYIDKQFVCSHRADGLIIATPTGSTAYGLSAGGPIVQPNVNAIVIIPMFPHTLTDRPIIIPADSEICINFSSNNDTPARVSCGGAEETVAVTPGTLITIKKAKEHLMLLHPNDYDYYETLRSKLHWGHRLTS